MPAGGCVVTFTDLTERKKAEREIAEKSALLETTFESMSQGFAAYDADLRLTAFNQRYLELRDYPPGFIHLGMPFEKIARYRAERGDYGPGDVEELVKGAMERARLGTVERSERTLPDGLVTSVVRDPLPGGGFVVTITDITERKRAGEALRQSEELFSKVFHASPGMFTISRPEDGAHHQVSENWIATLGYSRDEAMAKTAVELGIWADIRDRTRFVERLKREGSVRDFEAKFRTKSGEELDVLVAGEYLEFGGEPHLLIVSHDITGRKRAQAALRESEERFRVAFENAPIGVALITPEGNRFKVNKALADFLGYSVEELTDTTMKSTAANLDDLGKSLRLRQRVLDGEITTYRNERRYRHKQGHVVWGEVSGSLFRNKDGEPEHFIAHTIDITERKRAEQEIAEKSALLETTLEKMSHGITVYDRNLDLLAFNQRYVDLWDYPAGFIRLGMPFEEVARFGAQRGDYGPGDVEELVRRRVETRRRGEVYQYERVMPNGTIMAINREAMPGGGTVTTYTDITERKRAEEEIAEKSALLEKTFQNMSQGLSVFDADLRLVAFNERYVDMWRFPEGFIRLGMPFEEIARFKAERGHYGSGDVEELIKRPIEAMRQGKHWRDKCGAPSGAVFESHRDPMPGGGVINTFTDITERKRAEAALRAREARLSELQTELLNVSRQSAMGELSSALAHELNQPLAAIMNYVQASRRMIKKTGGVVSEKAYEMMDKALDQADRAGAIVRGLREIVEKGEAARAASDINKVVEEASALGLIGAARAGIRLDLELGNELPPVNINEIQIQQVVMNLVRNGVEAMAASEKRDLTIKTALDHEDAVEIAIGDTGPGLAEEVEERLFQPFVTTKAGGMGIGLSISHSIVEAHGGRLWATPAPDGGTVFHFTLPLAPDGAEDNDE